MWDLSLSPVTSQLTSASRAHTFGAGSPVPPPARVSSIVLPRQVAGLALWTVTASEEHGQFSYSHDSGASSAAWISLCFCWEGGKLGGGADTVEMNTIVFMCSHVCRFLSVSRGSLRLMFCIS